jgi:mycothiol synthase
MLLSGLHRLKGLGMDTASLGVDADNPNGALRLYESVGFSKVFTRIAYVKDVY